MLFTKSKLCKKTFAAFSQIALLTLSSKTAFAFGQDICFDQSTNKQEQRLITNCIPLPDECRSDKLSFKALQSCKRKAFFDGIKIMSGRTNIIGGRSMVHMDATYYLAQLIGFKPEEAYQIAIYDEAADTGQYNPFNQDGMPILSNEEIVQCAIHKTDKKCLLMTPMLSGVARMNRVTGGMLFHLPARFANRPTPPLRYPTDYLLTPDLDKYIANLKDWSFGKYNYACVGGVIDTSNQCKVSTESNPITIHGHIPLFAADFAEPIDLNAVLGEQIINEGNTENGTPTIYSSQIDAYVSPHRGDLAKLGLFLHALQDRYSHHGCSDTSYIVPDKQGYEARFDSVACSQGMHLLSHGWEVGTNQSHANLKNEADRTIEPALSFTYDQLMEYARTHGVRINHNLHKQRIIDELLVQLSIEDPVKRLNAMVILFEKKGLTPLPSHGSNGLSFASKRSSVEP